MSLNFNKYISSICLDINIKQDAYIDKEIFELIKPHLLTLQNDYQGQIRIGNLILDDHNYESFLSEIKYISIYNNFFGNDLIDKSKKVIIIDGANRKMREEDYQCLKIIVGMSSLKIAQLGFSKAELNLKADYYLIDKYKFLALGFTELIEIIKVKKVYLLDVLEILTNDQIIELSKYKNQIIVSENYE